MRHLLRTIVITFRAFRHFNTASFATTSKESICRRVNNRYSVCDQEIIVKSNHQRICHSCPETQSIFFHWILLATNIHLQSCRFGSMETEIRPSFLIQSREFITWNICRRTFCRIHPILHIIYGWCLGREHPKQSTHSNHHKNSF